MINLNYRDSRPIYEQIRDELRKLIVTGALKRDEKLPSVRSLASELAINPNTIQRAMAQLEAEGFVYTVAGRGSFVAEDGDQGRRRMAELTEGLHDTILELRQLGMTEQQWLDLWREEDGK